MKAAIVVAAALVLCTSAAAAPHAAVPDYGAVAPVPEGKERPDPSRDYKVVFEVTQGAKDPAKPSPSLDRVARYVNILAEGGVPASRRHIVAVLDAAATEAALADEGYAARHAGAKNPNGRLIAELEAAGVDVRVCGQAMAAHEITSKEVNPAVQIDISALMTITNKQLDGYALVAD